jgi:hypothetical protein
VVGGEVAAVLPPVALDGTVVVGATVVGVDVWGLLVVEGTVDCDGVDEWVPGSARLTYRPNTATSEAAPAAIHLVIWVTLRRDASRCSRSARSDVDPLGWSCTMDPRIRNESDEQMKNDHFYIRRSEEARRSR